MAEQLTIPGQEERVFGSTSMALPLVAIVLDQKGLVIAADRDRAGIPLAGRGDWLHAVLGMDYPQACETLKGPYAAAGKSLAAGIRSVLEKQASSFEMEYTRSLPDGEHCYTGKVIRMPGSARTGVVVTHTDITTQKLGAAGHGSVQAHQGNILDSVSAAIISFNADLNILFFNQVAEAMFGYRSSEVLGKTLAMLIPGWFRAAPDNMASTGNGSDDDRLTLVPGPVAVTGFRKSGQELPLELSILMTSTPGNGTTYTATIRDITQRSQIEESERKQRALAEALTSAAYTLNSTLDLHEVLDHILAYVGLVVPHDGANVMLIEDKVARVVCLAGKYVRQEKNGPFLDDELELEKFACFQQVLNTRQSVIVVDTRTDKRWIKLQGAEWVRSSANIPISLAGQVIGFLNLDSRLAGTFTVDDTRRLEVFAAHAAIAIRNAQLYAAEHLQRLLAESLQQIAEAMTKSTAANDTLPLLLIRLKALINCSWGAVFLLKDNELTLTTSVGLAVNEDEPPIFPYQSIPLFYEPLSSGETLVVRDVQQLPDNDPLPALGIRLHGLIGVPIVAWDVVIGYLAVGNQMPTSYSRQQIDAVQSFAYQAALVLQHSEVFSELEISRSDLSEAQVRLARAAQLQVAGEIATGIAHQVNNPLTTIIAESYLLAKYLPPDSKHYESVNAIREAAYRAGTVIQRLVDFARAKPFALSATDVNESISNAAGLLRDQIEPHIAKLTLALGDEVPSIQGSVKHLEDVWLKLLLNARDAIDGPGSGEITVKSSYDRKTEIILITIRDNGHGIAPDRLEKIFKPFYSTKDKGTGLGLSICKDVIAKHRGTIRVESTQHQGTTVFVTLPADTHRR